MGTGLLHKFASMVVSHLRREVRLAFHPLCLTFTNVRFLRSWDVQACEVVLGLLMFSETIAIFPMIDAVLNLAIIRCPRKATGSYAASAYHSTIKPVRVRVKPRVRARPRDVPPVRTAPAIYVDVDIIAPSLAVIL
jgi:hypothetical protein